MCTEESPLIKEVTLDNFMEHLNLSYLDNNPNEWFDIEFTAAEFNEWRRQYPREPEVQRCYVKLVYKDISTPLIAMEDDLRNGRRRYVIKEKEISRVREFISKMTELKNQ